MAVHIGEGQRLQVVEGLDPQVPDNPVGDLVVDVVHQPLGGGGDEDGDEDGGDDGHQAGKIDISFPDDVVDALPRQDRDI